MFFPERIKNIKKNDKVLEIGPGSMPFPRANVYLEKRYQDDKEFYRQRGHMEKVELKGEVVYYDCKKFPFSDKEFDYVICSHVLEHVEDIEHFIGEINRVSKGGYLEFPTIYYDYIYNIYEHINLVFYDGNVIKWMKKSNAGMTNFGKIQEFFFTTSMKGYKSFINDIKQFMFQGFEWENEIKIKQVYKLDALCYDLDLLEIPEHENNLKTFRKRLKRKIISLLNKYL
jgi:SAM-dependent methyltransferase